MSLFSHVQSVWTRQREFRAVFTELARHSDRELRDMGIDRGDIARLAGREAKRRVVVSGASNFRPAVSRSPALVAAS